ncbi:hypothetical protein ACHQM5_026667 [Ranunculus cassubicifolius]
MVGLSILLESQKSSVIINQPISIKPSLPSPPSSSSSPFSAVSFLDSCFLCRRRLLPGKDIYMYKGDRGFCSVECRCRQILMDEENVSISSRERKCSSSSSSRQRKGNKNRSNGFAY